MSFILARLQQPKENEYRRGLKANACLALIVERTVVDVEIQIQLCCHVPSAPSSVVSIILQTRHVVKTQKTENSQVLRLSVGARGFATVGSPGRCAQGTADHLRPKGVLSTGQGTPFKCVTGLYKTDH